MKNNIKTFVDVGQKIEIELQKDASTYIRLKSSIIKIANSNTLVISSPIKKGRLYPIHIGNRINIIFYKKNTGKYYFWGEVINRENKYRISLLYIKKIGDIKKLQRRSYFRLSAVLNINLDIIDNDIITKQIKGLSKDISGGGIRLICKEKISVGSLVKCKIPVNNEIIEVEGEVIRSEKVQDSLINYDTAIRYKNVDEKNRSKIIKFIFDKQRKIIKKGLI